MSTLQEIKAAALTLSDEEVVSLETFLHDQRARLGQTRNQELEEMQRRTGFYPLPMRPGGMVTDEMVQRIREEEGI